MGDCYTIAMLNDLASAAVTEAVEQLYGVTGVDPQVVYPDAKTTTADFATNIAFRLAKQLKLSPQEVGEKIAGALTKNGSKIATAEAVRGFINLTLAQECWLDELRAITPVYGHTGQGSGQKLQVEFVSANPTGPTTIGNARGGYIGDTLARVMQAHGYQVTREYYFNNAGTQISKLLESVKVSAGLVEAEEVQYRGEYIEQLATELKADLKTKPDDELKELITQAILKRWIEPAITKMGITFDVWFNEQDLITKGYFDQTMEKLQQKGLLYKKDGATWLDTGKLGVAREARVIVKSSGDLTYLATDVAYHDDIFGRRGFDVSIKVWGPDHIDQFPSLRETVLALHPGKRLEMAGHQYFRLIKEGKEVKVSKRLGQFVTIEQLIDEVGPDVARFMTLMRSADAAIDFDLDLATEQSQKNPYYYVMYSYVRARSILEQASKRGLAPVSTLSQLSEEELPLVRQMSRFPELLSLISRDFGVHRLTFFGIELAKLFHDLYESERIIDLDRARASHRLYLIDRYLVFMQSYFEVLGLTAVERMERSKESAAD